jgi:hypothetical protein
MSAVRFGCMVVMRWKMIFIYAHDSKHNVQEVDIPPTLDLTVTVLQTVVVKPTVQITCGFIL